MKNFSKAVLNLFLFAPFFLTTPAGATDSSATDPTTSTTTETVTTYTDTPLYLTW